MTCVHIDIIGDYEPDRVCRTSQSNRQSVAIQLLKEHRKAPAYAMR
jgi:hypothetical protein